MSDVSRPTVIIPRHAVDAVIFDMDGVVTRTATTHAAAWTQLFDAYLADPGLLPPEWRRWCEECGRARGVCDYVAGMTVRFAEREYARHCCP